MKEFDYPLIVNKLRTRTARQVALPWSVVGQPPEREPDRVYACNWYVRACFAYADSPKALPPPCLAAGVLPLPEARSFARQCRCIYLTLTP